MTTEIRFSEDPAAIDPLPDAENAVFQWTKQWYPVAVAEFLDGDRPHAIQLLGKDLVLWRDGTGHWRCFDDVCPHRLAPLSEGRVEADGTLLCAYHAWRFDAKGHCVSIPQSKDAATEASNCANPKACTVAYPTQIRQGLIWVWAEAGPQAWVESQLIAPRLTPELEDTSGKVVKLFWNVRDLPYGWDFFMENVSDPAHVPVSHHGIVGSRYKDAKYYDMPRVRDVSTQDGFAFAITPTSPPIVHAVHDFQPPCLMRIVSTFADGGQLILVLYASPMRPGWCRHIGCQVFVKSDTGKRPQGLGFFGLPMPAWVGHILASLFLHQDMAFLHYQEQILAKRGDRWLETVYTPNPQDKMVIALRQWFAKRAGGRIPWAGADHLLPAVQDKQQLFDVWTTHTQQCHACQKALKQINRLTLLAFGLAGLAAALAIVVDARTIVLAATVGHPLLTLPAAGVWWLLGGATVCTIVGILLRKFRRLFYTYPFEHAHND